MYFSFNFPKSCNVGDTTLCLDGFGYGTRETVTIGNSQANISGRNTCMTAPDDGCKLVLGLGPTPSAYSNEYSPSEGNKAKGITTLLNHGLSSKCDSILKPGSSGGTNAVSSALGISASTCIPSDATHHHLNQVSSNGNIIAIPIFDEGSTSAKKSGGYMRQLILAPRVENPKIWATNKSSEPSASLSDYSMSAISEPGNDFAVSSNHRCRNVKKCMFSGCTKGTRGARGLCIGHGGRQRCQKSGCNKGAESQTTYCKAHGGGKRCQHLGCTKSAEGSMDYCIAHGRGRCCGHQGGCTKAARGKSGLCIRHGGGKRCNMEGCSRSAEGKIGLCISHGGGRRCQFIGCTKGAQGSTMFCKAHGGGKRCVFTGCTKGAEGSTPLCKRHGGGKRCMFDGGGICPKSVHGGTNFCVAHGGGKRCAVPGCTKSARGRTNCCVKHGGGKRCRFQNCGKSAQGSIDLCKAHGGGKRCSWGEWKCKKFARGKSGLCAAHICMVLGRETNRGMIGPGLFHGLVPPASITRSSIDNMCLSSSVSVISDSIDSLEKPAKRQQLIPPQVLVPLSMKSSLSSSGPLDSEKQVESFDLAGPEGRVHGGGLLSLLGGDLSNAISGR